MRRQQCIETIVPKQASKRHESNLLQNDITVRIGKDFFLDTIAIAEIGVHQPIPGHAMFERLNFKPAMTLLFREEVRTAGDNQSEVARAWHIHTRVVDFIQNAVTQREPDFTGAIERGAHAAFRARGPARSNARPSGSKCRITHDGSYV